MLKQTLQQTIKTLNSLIDITKEDIKNIKEANHNAVFANMQTKEDLAIKFSELKSKIDSILVARNKPLEEIFTKEEEQLFDEFRNKLFEFHSLHKRYSKLALSVANFYNTLWQQITQREGPVTYEKSTYSDSKLQLKA
jgi:methionyl-tRNA formyltransferase